MAKPKAAAALEDGRVYAVTEHHNCDAYMDDSLYYQGTLVVAIYSSRQTAQQHADRDNLTVTPMDVLTKLRKY